MKFKHCLEELQSLVFAKASCVILIEGGPNLLNDVLEQLLAVTKRVLIMVVVLMLHVHSVAVWLADEHHKQDLWHISLVHEFNMRSLPVSSGNIHLVGILLKLLVGLIAVIVRVSFVEHDG